MREHVIELDFYFVGDYKVCKESITDNQFISVNFLFSFYSSSWELTRRIPITLVLIAQCTNLKGLIIAQALY